MEVEPTHVNADRVGLKCHNIDIDSVTHLKRMIELNVGNADMLQRELGNLLDDYPEQEQETSD
jgi:hypothetical protein